MSSSSLRQHQKKSAITTDGHSPLARNHSAGASTPHHSSSTSFATQRSYRSLPSPTRTTTTTTTTTTNTANILHENDDDQLNEKNPSNTSNNSIFNFDRRINNFHNSSINHKPSETSMPHSTRLLCGSIIPLQSSSSSPNIDRRSIENDTLNSPTFSTPTFRKPDLKYRSYILIFSIKNFIQKN